MDPRPRVPVSPRRRDFYMLKIGTILGKKLRFLCRKAADMSYESIDQDSLAVRPPSVVASRNPCLRSPTCR